MARIEQDREDLLREATALVERIELTIAAEEEPVTAGFRAQGAASFYFGAAPVYQFNTRFELRRACDAHGLLRVERRQLVRLTRQREADVTRLLAQPLSAQQQTDFLQAARRRLIRLAAALHAAAYEIRGQAPAAAPIAERLIDWLAQLPDPLVCAEHSRVE